MKKMIAVIIAVIMILSLVAGCGSNNQQSGTSQSSNTTSTTQASETKPLNPKLFGWQTKWNNYGLPTDPITLTVCVGMQDLQHIGIEENISFEMIKEATGITLDWVGVDNEKFAVLAAGKDLPDLIITETDSIQTVADLIKSGTLINMEPLLTKYGENINPVYNGLGYNWVKYWTKTNADNEGIYFLPTAITNIGDYIAPNESGSGWGLNIRYDIYSAIGAPPVTDQNGFNEDLLLNMLKSMQDYARNKLGVENAYAMAGFIDWSAIWTIEYPYCFEISGQTPNQYNDNFTGEYKGAYHETTNFRWNSFRFYNKAYRMGILDPETFIMQSKQYEQKVWAGQLLTAVGNWFFGEDLRKIYPDANGYLLKGMPYLDGVRVMNAPLGWTYGSARGINSKCKYQERAMALLDYLDSDEFLRCSQKNGLQGVDWEYDKDGKPMYIGDKLAAYKGDQKAIDLYGVNKKYEYGCPGKLVGIDNKMCADGYPSDFTLAPYFKAAVATETPYLRKFFDTYKAGQDIKFPGQLYQQWVDEGLAKTNPEFSPQYSFAPKQPDDLAQIQTRTEAYIGDNQSKLVLAKSEAEFNKVLDDICKNLDKMGEGKVYDDTTKRYDESKKIAAELGK